MGRASRKQSSPRRTRNARRRTLFHWRCVPARDDVEIGSNCPTTSASATNGHAEGHSARKQYSRKLDLLKDIVILRHFLTNWLLIDHPLNKLNVSSLETDGEESPTKRGRRLGLMKRRRTWGLGRQHTIEVVESRLLCDATQDATCDVVCGGDPADGTTAGDSSAATTTPLPDFSLPDLNTASPRAGQNISPHDYLRQTSVWYFGHAT